MHAGERTFSLYIYRPECTHKRRFDWRILPFCDLTLRNFSYLQHTSNRFKCLVSFPFIRRRLQIAKERGSFNAPPRASLPSLVVKISSFLDIYIYNIIIIVPQWWRGTMKMELQRSDFVLEIPRVRASEIAKCIDGQEQKSSFVKYSRQNSVHPTCLPKARIVRRQVTHAGKQATRRGSI